MRGPADVRGVHFFHPGDNELLVGIDINNNPMVQDVWNFTPAWGYPFYSSTAWAEMQATTTLVVDRVLRFLIPKRTKMKSRKLFESAVIATAAYRPMPAGGASPRSAGMRPGSSFGTVRGCHGVDGNSPSSYFPLISRAGRASISSTSSRRSPTSGQPLRHRSTSCSIGSFCAIRRKQASGAVPRRRST
jgi:hypothetical protein